ncbi:MAG: rubredoxin [Methanobacteriaceae archaeon]|nr:rubredoxin [Methanobacteriaceae archaeon]
MKKWKCRLCGYIYDPETGDLKRKIEPGVPFEDLPERWVCPSCGAKKKVFAEVK